MNLIAGPGQVIAIENRMLSDDIARALKHIRSNFQRSLSVEEVANIAGLSYHHLCRKFRKETGTTVVELVNALRIDKARELLSTLPDPVHEVARKVGFTSTVQFHRTFKKIEGDTPMQYRKKVFGE